MELEFNDGSLLCNVTVFDQAWTSTREMSNSECTPVTVPKVDDAKSAAPILPKPGGYRPISPDDPSVQEMAQFATTTLSEALNAGPLTLIRVLSAATQTVSGTNFKMVLQLSGRDGGQTCEVIVFDQSWTQTRRVTTTKCSQNPKSAPSDAQEESATEVAEEVEIPLVTAKPPKPGKYKTEDPNDASVQEMAQFATSAISQSSNAGPLSLLQVIKASTQVVSGVNYKLTIQLSAGDGTQTCEVVVFDQEWTKTRELSSSNCLPDTDRKNNNSKAAPEPLVIVEEPELAAVNPPLAPLSTDSKDESASAPIETFSKVDPESQEVQELALFATNVLRHTMDQSDLELVRVLSSSLGTLDDYKLELELSGSDGPVTCDVVIHEGAKTRHFSYSSCAPLSREQSRRQKRDHGATGIISPMDPNSDKVKQLADFAVSTIALRSNEPSSTPDAVRVVKASQQLVSGSLYNLELDLGFTDCPAETASCTRRQKCTVTIWEQSWIQKREVTKLSCKELDKSKKSKKAHRLGGVSRADPSSEEIRSHVAVALQVFIFFCINLSFSLISS